MDASEVGMISDYGCGILLASFVSNTVGGGS